MLAASALAAPAAAQTKPSSPDAIANAAVDCWSATGPGSVDEAKLRQLGWEAGSMKSPDGELIASPLRFFGKSGSNVVLMLMNTANASGCTLTSRVAKPEEIGAAAQILLNRLQTIDPAVKGARQGQSIVYISGQRVAELVPTGTMEKPSTRIVIAYTAPEKK